MNFIFLSTRWQKFWQLGKISGTVTKVVLICIRLWRCLDFLEIKGPLEHVILTWAVLLQVRTQLSSTEPLAMSTSQ
jgi:hypothetical protein